jgi:uncharacterized cupredoxin-like copper-binding protein
MKRFTLMAVLLALAGTMTTSTTSAQSATTARGASTATTTTITVRGGEFYFKLTKKSIPRAGTVVFVFKNVGHLLHDFHIAGKSTPNIQPGQTAKLKIRFSKPGRYPYKCTIEGHADAGMRGVFTVK